MSMSMTTCTQVLALLSSVLDMLFPSAPQHAMSLMSALVLDIQQLISLECRPRRTPPAYGEGWGMGGGDGRPEKKRRKGKREDFRFQIQNKRAGHFAPSKIVSTDRK